MKIHRSANMAIVAILLGAAAANASFPPEPPLDAYLRPVDQQRAKDARLPCGRSDLGHGCSLSNGSLWRDPPCFVPVPGEPNSITSLPTDQCYKMTAPMTMSGAWQDEFEGQMFFAEATRVPSRLEFLDKHRKPLRNDDIWISVPSTELRRLGVKPFDGKPRHFLITFIGRRTLYRVPSGHMGMFDYEVIVDRILTLKPIR